MALNENTVTKHLENSKYWEIIWQNSLKQPMNQRKIIREIRNYFVYNDNENV